MDKKDGRLHLSNGTSVPLDGTTIPSTPSEDWMSPTASLAPSEGGPCNTVSDPGHLQPAATSAPAGRPASAPRPAYNRRSADHCSPSQQQLRVDVSHSGSWSRPEAVSSPAHRVSSAGNLAAYRSLSPISAVDSKDCSPGHQRGEGFTSPTGWGSTRSTAEKEMRKKVAAEAALARVKDMEARFESVNGLKPASRGCMLKDTGVPLKGSRQPMA